MAKAKGTTTAVLYYINSTNREVTISDIDSALQDEYTPLQVSNAANYLAREGKISRAGYAGHFVYSALPVVEDPTSAGVDVLENLLTAMAQAEPTLRRLQSALKYLHQAD